MKVSGPHVKGLNDERQENGSQTTPDGDVVAEEVII